MRFGPAAISPRSPAVPNARRDAKRSASSADASRHRRRARSASSRELGAGLGVRVLRDPRLASASTVTGATVVVATRSAAAAARCRHVPAGPRRRCGELTARPRSARAAREITRLGGPAGLEDLLVAQRRLLDAGGEVRDERHAEHLHAGLAGGDRLERRRHADDVAADRSWPSAPRRASRSAARGTGSRRPRRASGRRPCARSRSRGE